MLMNDILDRIINLAKMLGIDTSDGSKELAELKGSARGILLVNDEIKNTENSLSPHTAQSEALSLFCNQFMVDGSLTDDEKRAVICDKLKLKYGDYVDFCLIEALMELNTVCIFGNNGEVSIPVNVGDKEVVLGGLGRVLANYLSPLSKVSFQGYSMNFDQWDAMPYSFDEYDRFDLPFYILENF